jgi:hypothetical protein
VSARTLRTPSPFRTRAWSAPFAGDAFGHRRAMSSAILPIIIVIALVVLAYLGMRSFGRRARTESDALAHPRTPTLDYRVPDQQDPAVVSAALRAEGFTSTSDPSDARLLHVDCPSGVDRARAHVRSVIASVRTTTVDAGQPFDPGEVRFADER